MHTFELHQEIDKNGVSEMSREGRTRPGSPIPQSGNLQLRAWAFFKSTSVPELSSRITH